MTIVYICAQHGSFPYTVRRLRFEVPRDVDFAVAAYHHLKADEGRDYSKVWWYKGTA